MRTDIYSPSGWVAVKRKRNQACTLAESDLSVNQYPLGEDVGCPDGHITGVVLREAAAIFVADSVLWTF